MKLISNISYLSEKKDKRNFIIITILLFIAGFFEAASIALVLPFISLLIDKDKIINLPIVKDLFPNISDYSHENLIIFSLLIFLLFYFFKFFYLIFIIKYKNKVIFSMRDKISKKMFNSYLQRPYSFHLNQHTSTIILNCKSEVVVIMQSVFLPLIELFAEILTVIFIGALIFIIKPLPSLILLIISGFLFMIFNFFTKKKSKIYSFERQKTDEISIKIIQQTFSSIKLVILYLKKKFFSDQYVEVIKKNTQVTLHQQFFIDIPKYFLELIALVACLAVIFFVVISEPENLINILPLLALYMVAAFKMLPSLNRIIVDIQKIRNGRSALDEVCKVLKFNDGNLISNETETDDLKYIQFNSEINLKNISFSYADNLPLYNNLNLKIKKGEAIGIIGESGTGKSTLANLLVGLMNPSKGDILIDGNSIHNEIKSWHKIVGYMPQKNFLLDDTVENNIVFFDTLDNKFFEKIIKQCQLEKLISSLESGVKTLIGENGARLSGGQLQRISLARTLYKNPEILILDEATTSLDHDNEKKILDIIAKLKKHKTIIIISHQIQNLSFCDKIYELKDEELKIVQN